MKTPRVVEPEIAAVPASAFEMREAVTCHRLTLLAVRSITISGGEDENGCRVVCTVDRLSAEQRRQVEGADRIAVDTPGGLLVVRGALTVLNGEQDSADTHVVLGEGVELASSP